jgi:hypothetical protein
LPFCNQLRRFRFAAAIQDQPECRGFDLRCDEDERFGNVAY